MKSECKRALLLIDTGMWLSCILLRQKLIKVPCRLHHSWGMKKVLIFSPTGLLENVFVKTRKVSYSEYIYHVCIFLLSLPKAPPHLSTGNSTMKSFEVSFSFFFFRKIRILVKTRKITYLLIEQALPQFEKGGFYSRVRKSLII